MESFERKMKKVQTHFPSFPSFHSLQMNQQFHEDAHASHVEKMQSLLHDHPDLDLNSLNKAAPSHLLPFNGHSEVVKLLLARPGELENRGWQDSSFCCVAWLTSCQWVLLLLKDSRIDLMLADG